MAAMKGIDRVLAGPALTQRQVFTRAQAIEAGMSRSGLYRRVGSGLLVAHGPRTLHFAGVELDFRGRLVAGLLDLGPAALVSGESATALFGLDGFEDGPLQFLVPRERRDRSAIGEVTSTRVIGPLDRAVVGTGCGVRRAPAR